MVSRPTIIDVAKLAGVSKTTVSRVVNGDTKKVSETTIKKVQDAILALGYQHNSVASSLRTDKTNTVLLMIPDITNPFWPEVARGIQDVMDDAGYSVIFANNDWNRTRELNYLQLALRTRVDGILINPIHLSQSDLLNTGIPSVVLGVRSGYDDLDMVGSDSYDATRKALSYLIRLGHHRIALLLGRSETRTNSSRLEGYRESMQQAGLTVDEKLIIPVSFDKYGGQVGMRALLGLSDLPTAVLASNDLIALGALQVCSEMGYHVPEHISIMGIDDIYAASLTIPQLTTMRKQKYEIGQTAARRLLERIKGADDSPKRITLACQLEVRGSTGKLLEPV